MVLKERGDEHLGARSSDVALVVREELHPRFERKGDDLLTRVEVPLVQALTSSYVQVPLLDGDTMEVCLRHSPRPACTWAACCTWHILGKCLILSHVPAEPLCTCTLSDLQVAGRTKE